MRQLLLAAVVLAPGLASAATATPAATVEKAAEQKSPFGLTLGLEQGFGLQTDDDTTSAAITLTINPTYAVTDEITVGLSLAPYLEQTANPGDGKRADLAAASTNVSVRHASLFKEEFTGLNLSGGLTVLLPLTRDDVYNPRYPTPVASLGIDRKFYGFTAKYTFGYTHYFPVEAEKQIDHVDYGLGASERPEDYRVVGYNSFNKIGHTFSLKYVAFEKLIASGSIGLAHTNTFGPSTTSPERIGGQVAEGADANDKDTFAFSLGLDYQINDTYSASLGFSNLGPQRPTGTEFGGPGSDSVNGGPVALFFSEQAAAISVGVGASF